MATPKGWLAVGTAPHDYEFTTDRDERHSGTTSAVLRARKEKPDGFGTLVQELLADEYRGRRARFSGWIKAAGVEGWAGLWMRGDDAAGQTIAFDNMDTRPLSGTFDWVLCEVVLDLPNETAILRFGVTLDGAGTVWFDDAALESVGPEVAPTGWTRLAMPRLATNLNFEG